MPYSPKTHKSTSHVLYVPQGLITTNSSIFYKRPLKPRLDIYDNTGTTLLYRYDAFTPDADTDAMLGTLVHHPLKELNVTTGKNNNGASYTIFDENLNWSRKKASEGNIIRIDAGKTTSSRMFLFKGYVKKMRIKHIGNLKREITFTAIGEKAETNNVKITYQRAATSMELDTDSNIPRKPDNDMMVHLLVREVLESVGIQVTSKLPIKDRLHLDLSGINPEVDIRILSVSFIDVELSTFLNFCCEISGAYWDIRDGKFIFEYPKTRDSGIILKARTNEKTTDLADTVAYFVGNNGWEFEESIDKNDGFVTNITAKTIIGTKSVASNSESGGSKFNLTSLYRTFIAQQFTALDTRFITIKLVMSRIGDPTGGTNDPENPITLKGRIITDNNDNPTGSVITEFLIPYEGLTSDPTDVFINDIKLDPSVSSPNTKYWLQIDPIGIGRGDAVRWHHDNNVSVIGRLSAYAIGDKGDNPSWKVSNRGPTYNFTVFAKIQRIQFYSDQDAADRYNQTDSSIDVTYMEDVESVGKLAQMELSIRSNPVRIYDAKQVTIPNNKMYYGGEMVTIVDPVLGMDENENYQAEIQECDYNFSPNDLGLRYVTLKPLGEYIGITEDLPT